MSVDIKLKHSSVANRIPTSGDLVNGELALNLADEKIYMQNAAGNVVLVAGPNSGDGEYVRIAGDNMTGDLGVGGAWPNDAGVYIFGSGTTSGNVYVRNNVVDGVGAFRVYSGLGSSESDITFNVNRNGQVEIGDANQIVLQPNGSAAFTGSVNIGSANEIVLESTGNAAFTGNIGYGNYSVSDGNIQTLETDAGIYLRVAGTSPGWDVTILNNGNATFAGLVTATGGLGCSAGVVSVRTDADHHVWEGVQSAITDPTSIIFANGDYYFAGVGTFSNAIINLEPDDDANYTITTEEYEETIQIPVENGVANADLVNGAPEQQYTEQTVTKTREIKTYTGPTMNVKDSVLDLQLRLDTRDAQLEQALIRIQELESADSSALEARIAALEVDMNRFKAI